MFHVLKFNFLILLSCFLAMAHSFATTLVVPPTGDIVGEVQYAYPEIGETLAEVGRRFNIGYDEMVRANPGVESIQSLATQTRLIIPSQFIIPNVPRAGIVINLAEYRLYYFPADENVVITFPVGIGREGWNTPLGLTKITAKQINPTWRPTANVRALAEQNGFPLPEVFPAGPSNPLGQHVLRLGWPTFLIHGTNGADGIGSRVSAGCIRMLPSDIDYLFRLVAVGTQVRVINQPIKIGKQDGDVFMQMYPLLAEQKKQNLSSILGTQLKIRNLSNLKNNKVIQMELSYPSGLVHQISG